MNPGADGKGTLTGGAIFSIVGSTTIHVGRTLRANNAKGGSSRAMPFGESGYSESPTETTRTHRRCHSLHCLIPLSFTLPRAFRAINAKGGSSRAMPSRRIGIFRSPRKRPAPTGGAILCIVRTTQFTLVRHSGRTMHRVAPRGQCHSEESCGQCRPGASGHSEEPVNPPTTPTCRRRSRLKVGQGPPYFGPANRVGR